MTKEKALKVAMGCLKELIRDRFDADEEDIEEWENTLVILQQLYNEEVAKKKE